jgi:hypothetical protein
LSFVSSSTQIEARLWIENNKFVGSIGSGDVAEWGFPVDALMCLEVASPEFLVSMQIILMAIMYEASFSSRDLKVFTRPTYLVTPKLGFEPVKPIEFEGFSVGRRKKTKNKSCHKKNAKAVFHQKT